MYITLYNIHRDQIYGLFIDLDWIQEGKETFCLTSPQADPAAIHTWKIDNLWNY